MLFGFDPCLQLLHLDDAVAGFALAALAGAGGAYNLATEDTVCLSQAIKLAGRQPASVFEPMVNLSIAMGSRDALGLWPFDIGFLRHSCVADTTRARCQLGWAPTYTALEALQHLSANGQAVKSHETSEEALRAFLARKELDDE
jgi:UDP-glucose 4-epimerase